MNKLDAFRARAKLITEANKRTEAPGVAVETFADKLTAKTLQQLPTRNRLEQKQILAKTDAGKELRQVPYAEVERIIKMPVVLTMDAAELEEYNKQNVLAEAYEKGFRLFPVQAESFSAYDQYGGCFLPVAVGWGKTAISLAIANKGYAKGLKRILLIVPSQVFIQLTTIDIKWARTKIPLNVPIHLVGGREQAARRALCNSGKKGLYVMPYSYLSTKDTSEMLLAIQPQLIICDEAHNLANRTSARTRRLMDYVEKFKPEGVMLSGTITSKSIRDYFHLIRWALKDNNPLPNGVALANEWAAVIDAQATGTYGEEGANKGSSGPLMPLIHWAQRQFKDENFTEDIPGFRRAYKKRLTTAPGVVSSGDAQIGTSLIIANDPVGDREKCPGWEQLDRFMKKITDEWLTPNGDEIEHAIHCYKWLYELSSGMYNELVWPTPEAYAKRKHIPEADAKTILDKAVQHHAAGQVYAAKLRKWLQEDSKPGIDTPMLVGNDMSRNGAKHVGVELFELWRDWHELDFEGRPDRDSHAIRVCPYKINAAVAWAKGLDISAGGALMWVWHQETGAWLHEELVKAGIDALHCPAGDTFNLALLSEDNAKRIVVASMSAHGTGKNLQAFQHNYFLQWPRQATLAEQCIGRTHRMGQLSDELTMNTNLTLEFDQLNFAACLNDSLYIHQTTGNRQKLIYANYNPLPKIFPSAVLLERGMQNRLLSKDQEQVMRERFEQ